MIVIKDKRMISLVNWLAGYENVIENVRLGRNIIFDLRIYISYYERDSEGYGGLVFRDYVVMGYFEYIRATAKILTMRAIRGRGEMK